MVRPALLTLMLAGLGTAAMAEVHGARPAPPSALARLQTDAGRIATALEAANRYSHSPDQREDAKRAANAAEGAARWTLGMMIVGIVDTVITAAGVGLVWFTLREAKRTADATIKAAEAAKDTADAALAALDRPWLFIEEPWNVATDPAPDKELRYARIKVTNYGKMPAVVGSAKAVLFYSPGLFLADAFRNVVNPLPATMREFPNKSQAGLFIHSHGKGAFEEDKDLEAKSVEPFGKLNNINFEGGFVIGPGKTQDFFFRGDATIDVDDEKGIPVEHAAQIYLLGHIIYQMPTDEVEILTFCYEAKLGVPFRAYGGPPWNVRTRVRHQQPLPETAGAAAS